MTSRTLTAAAIGLVALLASACGGGVTTDQFISEANAVCEEHRGNIEEAASEVLGGGQMPSPQEFGQLAQETIIPETRQQLDELAQLEVPEDMASDVEAYLSAARDTLDQIEQNPAMIQDPANLSDINQQADELGLSQACHIGATG